MLWSVILKTHSIVFVVDKLVKKPRSVYCWVHAVALLGFCSLAELEYQKGFFLLDSQNVWSKWKEIQCSVFLVEIHNLIIRELLQTVPK